MFKCINAASCVFDHSHLEYWKYIYFLETNCAIRRQDKFKNISDKPLFEFY